MSHTSSRRWVNPNLVNQQRFNRINQARAKFCPESTAWTRDYDLPQHRIDLQQDENRRRKQKEQRDIAETHAQERVRIKYGAVEHPEPEIRLVLDGKVDSVLEGRNIPLYGAYGNNLSAVLCQPTAFSKGHQQANMQIYDWCFDTTLGRPVTLRRYKVEPQWPSPQEMKYEGDERVATETVHERCLAAPRDPGNNTVNWMQRTIIDQYPLDDVRLKFEYIVHYGNRKPEHLHDPAYLHDIAVKEYIDFSNSEWDGRPVGSDAAITEEGVSLLDADVLACLDD